MTRQSPVFFFKKSLGQNFLINAHVRDKIISACELNKTDIVLEIGPGDGMLTQAIAAGVDRVMAVEADRVLADKLKAAFDPSHVEIVHADILKYPFEQLPDKIKVIGNLPYNIATPIIEKIINHRRQITAFFMTVQLEHGLRITAQPHSKEYGSFSCFVQYHGHAKRLFSIKNTCFYPTPKVQSCFIRFDPYESPLIKADDEELFFKIIRLAFQQRRKNLLNALEHLIPKNDLKDILAALEISHQIRPENLNIADFVKIANKLKTVGEGRGASLGA